MVETKRVLIRQVDIMLEGRAFADPTPFRGEESCKCL